MCVQNKKNQDMRIRGRAYDFVSFTQSYCAFDMNEECIHAGLVYKVRETLP